MPVRVLGPAGHFRQAVVNNLDPQVGLDKESHLAGTFSRLSCSTVFPAMRCFCCASYIHVCDGRHTVSSNRNGAAAHFNDCALRRTSPHNEQYFPRKILLQLLQTTKNHSLPLGQHEALESFALDVLFTHPLRPQPLLFVTGHPEKN
jgi:hypothetical protein